MSLSDLHIAKEYRNLKCDVINDFYIPILSNAVMYKRAVGFFNSAALYEFKDGQFIETEESGKPLLGCGEIRSGLLELSNADFKGNISYFQMAKLQLEITNKLISTNKELLEEALRLVGS